MVHAALALVCLSLSDPQVHAMARCLERFCSAHRNHVLFVHPVFASCSRLAVAYETQALGRCLRVGQTKRVFLWRFVTLGTVEEELSYRPEAMAAG